MADQVANPLEQAMASGSPLKASAMTKYLRSQYGEAAAGADDREILKYYLKHAAQTDPRVRSLKLDLDFPSLAATQLPKSVETAGPSKLSGTALPEMPKGKTATEFVKAEASPFGVIGAAPVFTTAYDAFKNLGTQAADKVSKVLLGESLESVAGRDFPQVKAAAEFVDGIARKVPEIADFLSTPLGVQSLFLGNLAPRLVAAGFAGPAAISAERKVQEAIKSPTPGKVGEAVGETVLTAGLARAATPGTMAGVPSAIRGRVGEAGETLRSMWSMEPRGLGTAPTKAAPIPETPTSAAAAPALRSFDAEQLATQPVPELQRALEQKTSEVEAKQGNVTRLTENLSKAKKQLSDFQKQLEEHKTGATPPSEKAVKEGQQKISRYEAHVANLEKALESENSSLSPLAAQQAAIRDAISYRKTPGQTERTQRLPPSRQIASAGAPPPERPTAAAPQAAAPIPEGPAPATVQPLQRANRLALEKYGKSYAGLSEKQQKAITDAVAKEQGITVKIEKPKAKAAKGRPSTAAPPAPPPQAAAPIPEAVPPTKASEGPKPSATASAPPPETPKKASEFGRKPKAEAPKKKPETPFRTDIVSLLPGKRYTLKEGVEKDFGPKLFSGDQVTFKEKVGKKLVFDVTDERGRFGEVTIEATPAAIEKYLEPLEAGK